MNLPSDDDSEDDLEDDDIPTNSALHEYLDELTHLVDMWGKFEDDRKDIRLRGTYTRDPNTPICLKCQNSVIQGFLVHCPLFELPEEDEKVVGQYGDVYYFRKGHKPKTYPNVPMEAADCKSFERAW